MTAAEKFMRRKKISDDQIKEAAEEVYQQQCNLVEPASYIEGVVERESFIEGAKWMRSIMLAMVEELDRKWRGNRNG